MLSKSQARWFFLLGTIVSALIFISLTVDSIRYVYSKPTAKLTEDVIRGKRIWEKNNCMGCHTILGEGAYYAPELTKSYERRGPDWIRLFLKDPQAMYPGQRKMVKYNFSEEEISDVIAFLKWNGELDLNGFPAKTNLQMK